MSKLEPVTDDRSAESFTPANLEQLRQVIHEASCVMPVGNRTKQPLSYCDQATLVSLRALRGIIEYEPSEFTFTAWAGTPVSEIAQALGDRQQYLPFDPMLVQTGATIGGTVAAGLSGPGRFRYGGVRDFLVGVKLLGGDGKLVQGGGKVVKNAAGFDLPKFLVGSMGRYALMVELSFKVFPRPASTRTLRIPCESHHEAVRRISSVASSRWEADAIDYRPGGHDLFVRLAAPPRAVNAVAAEIQSKWPGGEVLDEQVAERLWQNIVELRWKEFAQPVVAKVPTTNASFLALQRVLDERADISVHLSVAGGVAWILLDGPANLPWLSDELSTLGLAGLVVRGECDTPRLGSWPDSDMRRAVKLAMDPLGKFPGV